MKFPSCPIPPADGRLLVVVEDSAANPPAMDPANDCNEISILLVDDDEGFRMGVAGMLSDDGHEVFDYPSPSEIPGNGDLSRVIAVVTDYEMPGENGISFADRFHAAHPEAPIILVTGFRTEGIDAQVAARPFLRILSKPIQYLDLHRLIHELST